MGSFFKEMQGALAVNKVLVWSLLKLARFYKNCIIYANFSAILLHFSHGLRTLDEANFQLKSQTFGFGQTNWTDKFWSIWGIFAARFISTHFGTVIPLSMFFINQPFFLQKKLSLYICIPSISLGLGFEFKSQTIKQTFSHRVFIVRDFRDGNLSLFFRHIYHTPSNQLYNDWENSRFNK